MKKIITAVAMLILIMPGLCFGAVGTLTLSSTEDVVSGGPSKILTIAGVASSTDGTWPALAVDADSQRVSNTFLMAVEFDPGTTAPNTTTIKICYTDDYTTNGATNCADLLKTAGTSLSVAGPTANFEPYVNSTTMQQGPKYISRSFTVIVTQAAAVVNSATLTIKLTFAR